MQEKLFMSCMDAVCALKNCSSKVYLKKRIQYITSSKKIKKDRTPMTVPRQHMLEIPQLALSNRENNSFTFGANI